MYSVFEAGLLKFVLVMIFSLEVFALGPLNIKVALQFAFSQISVSISLFNELGPLLLSGLLGYLSSL